MKTSMSMRCPGGLGLNSKRSWIAGLSPARLMTISSWKQPGPGCFHELMVIKRAGLRPAIHERFEFKPKPPGQRMDILVFIDDAGGDEHTIGADAGFAGALLHLADNVKGQAVTNAVELGKVLARRAHVAPGLRLRAQYVGKLGATVATPIVR